MTAGTITRRDISMGAGSILAALGVADQAFAATGSSQAPMADENAGISRNNAAIHQEVAFAASLARVYDALTVTDQFDRVVGLSAAMNSGMKKTLGAAPTRIDAQPGGAFSLFGGYVTGRMLELVANTRIVQAWRAGSWDPGLYSVAMFALVQQGAGTRLVFDQRGFPDAAATHLAEGWHINYWVPLAKFLA
jgi:activator of HSP90 ATPase